ncbi:MAG: alpha-ketoglutarate-dependent dioxygenase AlkB family protein [Hyphomicrobium sp.]
MLDNGSLSLPDGFEVFPQALDSNEQKVLLHSISEVLRVAPLFQPRMPKTGKPFSVRMSNCGPLGWVSDKEGGYRYQEFHPETGKPWPPFPKKLLELWQKYAKFPAPPEACLINYYPEGARMGSHRDADENEPRAPVLSVSLGDEAVFHMGGLRREDRKARVKLCSGDVAVMGGASRFAYHGIDKILASTSPLVEGGGRINLTLRRVTKADL